MIIPAAVSFGVSACIFVLWALLVSIEQRRGRRLFLVGLRSWIDHIVERIVASVLRRWQYLARYIVQLNWYYSLHAMLQGFLRVIVATYHYFERAFEQNRKRTKRLRAEKRKLTSARTHLEEVADHKIETALTSAQKQKLRDKKLKGD
jgi:hypothetical protein